MLNLRTVLGDERGFVHKRIFRGIKGAVGGLLGGPAGIIGGATRGFLGGGAAVPGGFRVNVALPARQLSTAELSAGPCQVGFWVGPAGQCIPRTGAAGEPTPAGITPSEFARQAARAVSGFFDPLLRGVSGGGLGGGAITAPQDTFGPARVGRFGAGLEPTVHTISTRICPPGAVLAVDGLCYNRRDIRNSERAWPRGRRPLLTGGEMRCISVASRAANKLQRKQKQLQELGLLKKPAARRAPPKAATRGVPGVVQIQQE